MITAAASALCNMHAWCSYNSHYQAASLYIGIGQYITNHCPKPAYISVLYHARPTSSLALFAPALTKKYMFVETVALRCISILTHAKLRRGRDRLHVSSASLFCQLLDLSLRGYRWLALSIEWCVEHMDTHKPQRVSHFVRRLLTEHKVRRRPQQKTPFQTMDPHKTSVRSTMRRHRSFSSDLLW